MRIALIYPAIPFDSRYHRDALPSGLLYLAAVAEQRGGARVDVFDSRHGPALPDPGSINRYDLIGFTAMSSQVSHALRLVRRIRDAGFRGRVAFGGPHASVAPEHLKSRPGVDAVFIGEAEDTFLQYLRLLEGQPHALQRAWIRVGDGSWQFHPGEDFVNDLDALPFPAREKYEALVRRTRFINLTTTRGCPYRCNYCQPTKRILFGKRVRRRSIGNVLAELEDAVGRFGITHFSIDDDTFTFDEEKVVELCGRVKPLGLRWSCQTRSDIGCSTLEAMRDSGCELLYVGAESGSQRVLDLMEKSNTVEKNAEFIRTCNELGLTTWCNMMVGYPGETREDLERSLQFVRQTRPTRVCVTQVTPFPGTHLWERHHDDVIEKDWDKTARHVIQAKFRSMAPLQGLISYYAIVMGREYGEPLVAELLDHTPWLGRLARRFPRAFQVLVHRYHRVFQFLTRGARGYLEELEGALAAVRAGRVDEGIGRLEGLKRRFPLRTAPLGHLGWIYLTTGHPEEAIENYARLVALEPDNAEAQALLVRTRAAAQPHEP